MTFSDSDLNQIYEKPDMLHFTKQPMRNNTL